ncbi:hypothetical protein BKA69DRAFT_1087257 [Paraphysoderma sedebokerense]|nr:hypothetical protein BKA69DRAFT_1087257 [Paraphysoderma sedebokerense]
MSRIPVLVERIENQSHSVDYRVFETTPKSSNDFLEQFPRGAYTSARTVLLTSIMDLKGHMSRLSKSMSLMHFTHSNPSSSLSAGTDTSEVSEPTSVTAQLAHYRDSATISSIVVPTIRHALETYYKLNSISYPVEDGHNEEIQETKVTVLCCYDFESNKPRTLVHCAQLSPPGKNSLGKCKVAGHPRKMAVAKDSQWVRDRKALEKLMDSHTNEVLLTDPATETFYEGLSSNFFAVIPKLPLNGKSSGFKDHRIATAPLASVLTGTILKIVQSVAESDGIEMVYDFPREDDLIQGRWSAAFVTSTSRLVLPLERIEFLDGRLAAYICNIPWF